MSSMFVCIHINRERDMCYKKMFKIKTCKCKKQAPMSAKKSVFFVSVIEKEETKVIGII